MNKENKLNNLKRALSSMGHSNEVERISDLLSELEGGIISKANSGIISKANWLERYFGGQNASDVPNPDVEKWQKILDDFDKPAYRVEAFHRLAEGIASTITAPLRGKTQSAASEGEIPLPSQSDRSRTIEEIQATASTSNKNSLLKIASKDAYMRLIVKEACDTVDTIVLNLPEEYLKSIDSSLLEEETHLVKEAIFGAIGRGVMSAGRGLSRALPIVGLAISLPLAIKNTVEAWHNGVAIFHELPLEKYGISKLAIATGPAGILFLVNQIQTAINENSDDPEALYEILTIVKTLAAFILDIVFAVTNAIMAVIDAITVLAMIIPIDGPVGEAITGFAGAIISIALMGVEWGSEWASEKFWGMMKNRIKEIAETKIQELGETGSNQTVTEGSPQEPETEEGPPGTAFLSRLREMEEDQPNLSAAASLS